MRPVQLDMAGFATYRSPTVVDLSDVDYFALVGATGAGKSTIIDAIVFALYATVPRWDNRNVIAPALAPTANRGVVRLIFDVDGQRYAASREVRRSGGATSHVSLKNSRLERLLDPSDPAGDTELLAADSDVNKKIEELLGLSLEHFTTCVALPQGRFAEFLHAKPRDRQQILSSLLGYEVYDTLRAAAGDRSREQDQRARALSDVLETYADTTPAAVKALKTRAEQLRQLDEWLSDTGLVDLDAGASAISRARDQLTSLTDERDALGTVTVPDDVAGIAGERVTASSELATAMAVRRQAEIAVEQARAAIASHQSRHDLSELARQWEQLDAVQAGLPALVEVAETAALDRANAESLTADAERVNAERRAARAQHAANAERRAAALATAEKDLASLRGIVAPANVHALAADVEAAQAAALTANRQVEAAETEATQARSTLDAAPEHAVLTAATECARELATTLAEDVNGWDLRVTNRQAITRAAESLLSAEEALGAATRVLDLARIADQAGTLRQHLEAGQPCPVCEQTVITVPPIDVSAQLGIAETAHQTALQRHSVAADTHAALSKERDIQQDRRRVTLSKAETRRIELCAALTTLSDAGVLRADATTDASNLLAPTTVMAELTTSISDATTREQLRSAAAAATEATRLFTLAVSHRTGLATACTDAERALTEAKQRRRLSEARAAELDRQRRVATTELLAARDTVLALSAPAINTDELAAGWDQLVAWAASELASGATLLDGLRNEAEQCRSLVELADAAVLESEESVKDLRAVESRAIQHEAATVSQRDHASAEIDGLLQALADQPSRDEVGLLLTVLSKLEQSSEVAHSELSAAGRRFDAAERALEDVDVRMNECWTHLRASRDPLIVFGAPPVSEDDLLAAWSKLATWARERASSLGDEVDRAGREVTASEAAYRDAVSAVRSMLTEHSLVVDVAENAPHDLHRNAATTVASALASAADAAKHARRRLVEQRGFRRDHDAAVEAAQVANTLAMMLRSDRFQAWLLETALGDLVDDASTILLEMSSGQFELRSEDKDLLVVDHNDADMLRPVKTLSGGETFQASLALALALSRQVAALAAASAAKLESIFLDEGFGTLDEGTLDVVATTLENLAASGDRMVGVITHVPTLADRIPVRYEVTRSGTSSSIQRVTT